MKGLFVCLLLSIQLFAFSQGRTAGALNGEWTFAMDPLKVGEPEQWYDTAFASRGFDKVQVPHCYSVDPRYFFYTGTAWYFRKFSAQATSGHHQFLQFDAVFYKTKIWLNGVLVGTHEGGYTPFEFDVTSLLKPDNVLAVQVDNSWDTTTIPGAKTAVKSSPANNSQLYPWINYGGITRPVHLLSRPSLYISKTKINAEPDLVKGDAKVAVTVKIRNSQSAPVSSPVNVAIYRDGIKSSVKFKPVPTKVNAGEEVTVSFTASIPSAEVKLWSQDEPFLYNAVITCGTDTVTSGFGIRKIEVKGTRLLLNGAPVKMGGCNRPLDYPGYGSMDPQEVLDKDLPLIKSGGMELSRINHYPVTEGLLNWADQHGLLIIEEAGNWQMTPKQMDDTLMRRKFRQQMQEMIERDWNHASVIAYSVGNEFPSQTTEGQSWVRDMSSFVKTLDSTRLITFASMFVWRDFIKKPEEEASQYVDFVSANIYGDHLKHLQHIHELYPGKPVYISEFGIRTDAVKTEEDRLAHLKKAMQDFRQCSDYLIGASVWTFNDYFSRYPGTNANGYRPWGLVGPDRQPRGMYTAWQEEFAPATIELTNKKDGYATLVITARKDFPSYTMKGYKISYDGQEILLNTLQPGEKQELLLNCPTGQADISLVKPGGFIILKKTLK